MKTTSLCHWKIFRGLGAVVWIVTCSGGVCTIGGAEETIFRFPRPEFTVPYEHVEMYLPPAATTPPWLDIVLLVGVLTGGAWAVLRQRSRNWTLALCLVSLAYFGFYRKGCVCSVGSIQNVLDASIGSGATLPLAVAVFFIVPILTALYFGRIFCAVACPLGTVQELCAVRPVQVSRPVDEALGLLAYAYLGITVVGIWTGCGYLICRYDPFVGFFRLGGSFNMILTGGLFLVGGIFIARPYCRYLCPYGVLLRWASVFARYHAEVAPATCVQCRLCEEACPYNAILKPVPQETLEPPAQGVRRLARLLVAFPIVVVVAAIAGWYFHPVLARLHPTVRLAEQLAAEQRGKVLETTPESDAFRERGESPALLYAEASTIVDRFKSAGVWLGIFLAISLCGRIYRLSVVPRSFEYKADRGACLSCARCFKYCPVENPNA